MKEMAQIWEHWEDMFYLQEQETETEVSYENNNAMWACSRPASSMS